MSFPDVRYPPYYIRGLKLKPDTISPDSKIIIEPGYWKEDTNTYEMITSVELTIDITVSGAGGLDQGAEAANTWYYVYIIQESATSACAGLLSLSSTAPLMPDGYIYKRRIGSVRNDSSSNFLPFRQEGLSSERLNQYWVDQASLVALAAGNAQVWTEVDISSFVPVVSTCCIIGIYQFGTPNAYVRPKGMTGTDLMFAIWEKNQFYAHILLNDRKLEYYNDAVGGSLFITVNAWHEEI